MSLTLMTAIEGRSYMFATKFSSSQKSNQTKTRRAFNEQTCPNREGDRGAHIQGTKLCMLHQFLVGTMLYDLR